MCALDVRAWFDRVSLKPTNKLRAISRLAAAMVFILLALPWLFDWWLLADLEGWPLNDDPFYAKPLAMWAQDGRVQFVRQYGFLTASSVAHIATGALATTSGFSFRWLYLICIVQQAFGASALYWMARRLRLPRPVAVLAAASLVSFPLYFGHAFTFMTDGPAAAWSCLACVALSLGLIERNRSMLAAGALAVGWGYWIRQTNGALLIAPCIVLAASGLKPGNHLRPLQAWPLSLALLIIVTLESGYILPASSARLGDIAPQSTDGYWKRVVIALYGWLLLAGWYTLPIAPWLVGQVWRGGCCHSRSERYFCHCGAAVALIAGGLPLAMTAGRAHLTNATGSFIQNGHYGPIFLSDMDEPQRWGTLGGVQWPPSVWQALSVLSILSAGAVAWWASWAVLQWRCHPSQDMARPLIKNACGWLFMLALSVAALALFVEPHLDRYWLFLMPILTVFCLMVAADQKWTIGHLALAWGCGCVVLQLIMSTVFVHDMLAWNHARWQFINAYLASGQAPQTIDGGRDVNAWLRMDEDPNTSARPGDDSRWWSGHAHFCISTGPRPGWQLNTQLPWDSWATGRTHYLLVLERSAP